MTITKLEMEHFKVRFKYQTGKIPAGTDCDLWVDKDRKYLRFMYFDSLNKKVNGWFCNLPTTFWYNIEFLYEINEDKDLIYHGVF